MIRAHSQKWLVAQLLDRQYQVLSEIARGVGGDLRHAVGSPSSGDPVVTKFQRYSREFTFAETPVYLGDGVFKLHGELTEDECRLVASGHRKRASEMAAMADRYDRLADAIKTQGVRTVAQIVGLETVL